jgi:hypothetical protein
MRTHWIIRSAALGLFVVSLALLPLAALAGDASRISGEELEAKLGQPGVVVIDVRAAKDWKGSDRKIKGAVREDPYNSKGWAARYDKADQVILYCA